jgi:hypothetical protein
VVIIPAQNQEFDSLLKLSARAFGNALMRVTGEKPGISEVLHQDVLSARLKRGIMDLPVKTSYGYCIEYEFHADKLDKDTVIRNYQYAIDLRAEVDCPVRPHIVSLDEKKTPIPQVELFPGVFSNPKVTFLTDMDGEKVLNTITDKLDNQVELDEMDAYFLALMPFFRHEKSREDMLEFMCHFVNKIDVSEVLKYIIKLVQILSAKAMFADDKQEEILGVIKMGSTYIDNYEKNLIKNAIKEVALKMKEDGVSSDFIFKYFGIEL